MKSFIVMIAIIALTLADVQNDFNPLNRPGSFPPRVYHKVGPYAFYTYPIDYAIYPGFDYG